MPPAAYSFSSRLLKRLGSPLWVVLTGGLLGLSFPPSPLWWLSLVALVPLLARWYLLPMPAMLLREAYSAFLLFAVIAGYWVLFHTSALTGLLSGLGLLLIPLLMALPVAGSSIVARRLGRPIGFATLVAGWLTLELLLTHGPIPLPWLLLGHTLAGAMPVNAMADLGGVGLLTLWLWLVNGSLFVVLRAYTLTTRFALTLTTLVLVFAAVGYGGVRATQFAEPEQTQRVMIVQPAMSVKAWTEIANSERVRVLSELSDQALTMRPVSQFSPHTLLLWPEGALPAFPDERLQRTLYSRLASWTARREVALLTGAITRYDTAPALTVESFTAQQRASIHPYYNSALLFQAFQQPQQYDKMHAILMADQVPLADWQPSLSGSITGRFTAGGEPTLFQVGEARFSTLIAYEALFGDHARRMSLGGAGFLTVLANAGWWNHEPAFRQHQGLMRLRAIETRRPVLLASVTGGSSVIAPDGTIREEAGWMQPTVLTAQVGLHNGATLYQRAGDVVYFAGLGLLLLLAGAWVLHVTFFRTEDARRSDSPRRRAMA